MLTIADEIRENLDDDDLKEHLRPPKMAVNKIVKDDQVYRSIRSLEF